MPLMKKSKTKAKTDAWAKAKAMPMVKAKAPPMVPALELSCKAGPPPCNKKDAVSITDRRMLRATSMASGPHHRQKQDPGLNSRYLLKITDPTPTPPPPPPVEDGEVEQVEAEEIGEGGGPVEVEEMEEVDDEQMGEDEETEDGVRTKMKRWKKEFDDEWDRAENEKKKTRRGGRRGKKGARADKSESSAPIPIAKGPKPFRRG
jgi:hypothetical protein